MSLFPGTCGYNKCKGQSTCLFLFLFPLPILPGDVLKNAKTDVKIHNAFFSPKFLVLGLTFKSLFHFVFVFNILLERVIPFHSFTCICSVFSTPFTEKTVFSTTV